MDSANLPGSPGLDVAALSRTFRHTTNSYKFLFFLSLLEILRRKRFPRDAPIAIDDILVEMLVLAWYPLTYFRLSFGSQDKTARTLRRMLPTSAKRFSPTQSDKDFLRRSIHAAKGGRDFQDLRRWVPYRLIRVFFENETRGLRDSKVNEEIVRVAEKTFEYRRPPLYCFVEAEKFLLVHRDWVDYFERNQRIVRGWAAWEWLRYVQSRNPSVPNVANKLFQPGKRQSLDAQSRYWKEVLHRVEIRCIYSDRLLSQEAFSLDHYLPWSFVAHDQLWNLVPVAPEANSSKGDALPSDRYFERFVETQRTGLEESGKVLPGPLWMKTVEPFLLDLALGSPDDLIVLSKLQTAYRRTLNPLLALAENQGYPRNWRYSMRQDPASGVRGSSKGEAES